MNTRRSFLRALAIGAGALCFQFRAESAIDLDISSDVEPPECTWTDHEFGFAKAMRSSGWFIPVYIPYK